MAYTKELAALRRQHGNYLDALRDKLGNERESHAKELRHAEAARINAIRDVTTLPLCSRDEVRPSSALPLSLRRSPASAEAMRSQVAAAATAAATSLAAALVPLTEAIADLRRAQYEAQGQRAQVACRKTSKLGRDRRRRRRGIGS